MQVPQTIGRYEILGSIVGGMGALLRAPTPGSAGARSPSSAQGSHRNDEIQHRFMQEANAPGMLEHENIVRIFDIGQQHAPFIAMGSSTADAVDVNRSQGAGRPHPPARLLEELSNGLALAHSFDIVHRDIKPANLVRRAAPRHLKILGFGLPGWPGSDLTSAGALIGSLDYMSPERVLGLPIDHRSTSSRSARSCSRSSLPAGPPRRARRGRARTVAEQASPRLSR